MTEKKGPIKKPDDTEADRPDVIEPPGPPEKKPDVIEPPFEKRRALGPKEIR